MLNALICLKSMENNDKMNLIKIEGFKGGEMELRVLRYFLAVAREETISGAAEMLHISQPTLSRQLMDMENLIGKPLFIRGKRKIILTEEGLLLRKRAQEIVDLVDKTQAELQTSEDIIEGDVYIGGGETEGMRILAKVAHKVQQQHKGVRYHLFSGNGDDVTDKLDKGLLDFGVLIEPSDMTKYEFLRLPENDTWGLLMRKDSSLSNKKFIEPQDLINIPLIVSRQTLVDEVISKWCGFGIDKLNVVATYNLVYNASLLVQQNMGYALCLDKLINTTGDSELCFKPLYPNLNAGLNIVWKKYQVFSKAANVFLQQLQQELALSKI